MKTSELTGTALDWAVAQCEYVDVRYGFDDNCLEYSTNWAQGGPIIEREKITWDGMAARIFVTEQNCSICVYGPTILIAAMRCYVASKLGNEVDLPEEFI